MVSHFYNSLLLIFHLLLVIKCKVLFYSDKTFSLKGIFLQLNIFSIY